MPPQAAAHRPAVLFFLSKSKPLRWALIWFGSINPYYIPTKRVSPYGLALFYIPALSKRKNIAFQARLLL